MRLGHPLIPVEAVEPVWFGLVDHVEDLAFEADGTVWCGGEEGQVYRGRLDGAPEIVARTPGRTYGFALGPDGACYCADVADPGIYRIDSEGEVERVSAGTADRTGSAAQRPRLPIERRAPLLGFGELGW